MIEQLSHQTFNESEVLEQHEVDAKFHSIIQLIELNSLLDNDLQADKIAALKRERDEIVGDLLSNPTEAFAYEFSLLARLYEGRTLSDTDTMGTQVNQFVTRNLSRERADLHFRDVTFSSGGNRRTVEVPRTVGDSLPFYITLNDNELEISSTVYERGQYIRKPIDVHSPQGQKLLTGFFTHSFVASDLVYNRTPEQIEQADKQARIFLVRKIVADRTVA